jgi:hypothetical protein
MSKITYEWANDDKTVLLCIYAEPDWTWQDFHEAFKIRNAMLDAVSHPQVHILVDVRKSHLMPKGGTLLSGINKLSGQKHPRQGHTVVVGAKGIVSVMSNLLTKFLGEHRQEFHLVDTMEEANALLSRIMAQQQTKAT